MMPPEMSEQELLQLIYAQSYKVLRLQAFQNIKNYHDDMVQMCVPKVAEIVKEKWQPSKSSVKTFITNVAKQLLRNKQVKLLRKLSRECRLDDDIKTSYELQNESLEDLLDDLGQFLTPTERTALELKLEGKTPSQIYKALHPTSNANPRHLGQRLVPLWRSIQKKTEVWLERRKKEDRWN